MTRSRDVADLVNGIGITSVWFFYDQTIPTIDSNYNVTSITDTATGNFTSNITNIFSAATYSTVTSSNDNGLNTTVSQLSPSGLAKTTSGEQYYTATTAVGGADLAVGVGNYGALA